MLRVDLGNYERNARIHSMISRIAHDDVARRGKGCFRFSSNGGIEGGEKDFRSVSRARRVHNQRLRFFRQRPSNSPRQFGVPLTCRAFARRNPRQAKPRMRAQHGDKILSNQTGCAQNADFDPPRCTHAVISLAPRWRASRRLLSQGDPGLRASLLLSLLRSRILERGE